MQLSIVDAVSERIWDDIKYVGRVYLQFPPYILIEAVGRHTRTCVNNEEGMEYEVEEDKTKKIRTCVDVR